MKHGLYFADGKDDVKFDRLRDYDRVKYEIYHAVKDTLKTDRIIIYLFLGWSIWLTTTNMKLRDNDLKYRYIKSANPNNEFVHHLEKVFKYDRDRKKSEISGKR